MYYYLYSFNTDHVTSNNNPLNQSINIVIGFTSDVLYEETMFFATPSQTPLRSPNAKANHFSIKKNSKLMKLKKDNSNISLNQTTIITLP